MMKRLPPVSGQVWLVVITVLSALRPLTWLLREWIDCPSGICAVSGTPPEWDFSMFWIAGGQALAHDFATIFIDSKFHTYVSTYFHYDIGLSQFAYPPPALLLFAPLALLSLGWAYALWVAVGLVVLAICLRTVGLQTAGMVLVFLSPAFLYNLLLGQNGGLTAALLIFSLVAAARQPARAGFAAALLLIKPQTGLLLPAALAGAAHWRAFGAALMIGVALILLSVATFGLEPWQLFIDDTTPEMVRIMGAPFPQNFQASAITIFILLRAWGVSLGWAQAGQLATMLLAMALAFWVARQKFEPPKRLALLLLLALLAMPYGYVYDMVGYATALALIWQWRGVSLPWAAFWVWPAFARDVTAQFGLPVTSLFVLAAFGWVVSLDRPTARPS